MAYAVLRPLSDWHEDDGDVLWYRVPISEPPFVSSPLSSDWRIETSDGRCVKVDDDEEGHGPWATHWHPLPRVIFESVVTEEDRLLAELAGLGAGVSTEDGAHRMEQVLQRLLEIEQDGALAIDREHERRMQDLDSTMAGLGLATRVEAKRLDEAQEEIAALREACTLALGIMEQKNRVTVLTTAKFVDVKFDQEDIAVLRAALEKKP